MRLVSDRNGSKKDFLLEPSFRKNNYTTMDDINKPLDPDPSPPPPEKHSVPQEETGLADAVEGKPEATDGACLRLGGNEEDASIWSGPSWWSWGTASVVSSHDWAQDVPDVYPLREDVPEVDLLEWADDDYDILEDWMSQRDYIILVASYDNGKKE